MWRWLVLACFVSGVTNVISGTVNSWVGGTGKWSNSSFWSLNRAPVASDAVQLNLIETDSVWIDESTTVSQFHLYLSSSKSSSGGIVYLSSGVNVTVSGNFTMSAGSIVTYQPYNNATVKGTFNFYGSSSFTSPNRKYLKYLNIYQYGSTTSEWELTDSTIILTDTTVHITSSASMRISLLQTKTNLLKADESRISFDVYSNRVLNPNAHLIATNPVGSGVYDMQISNVISIDTLQSTYGKELYPLLVDQDVAATDYYTNANIFHLPFGGDHNDSLYNMTAKSVDEDDCAHLCKVNYGQWCVSFDYYIFNHSCLLSKYRLSRVGGVSSISAHRTYPTSSLSTIYATELQETPWIVSHYEMRVLERSVDSYLINEGKLEILNNASSSASSMLVLSINLWNYGELIIGSRINVTSQRDLILYENSRCQIYNDSMLVLSSINSSLTMKSQSSLVGAEGLDTRIELQFIAGSHLIAGGTIANITTITLQKESSLTVDSSDIAEGEAFIWQTKQLTLQDFASLVLSNNRTVLKTDSLFLRNSSVLLTKALALTVMEMIWIDPTSQLSATGTGSGQGIGIGAGQGYSLGGSGASHGGRGGVGKVDATGAAYDSVIWPTEAGSGGGHGYYLANTGGSGGNAIQIQCKSLVLEGYLESAGAAGVNGGGGGSGGAIAVNCSELTGIGTISVHGGDGGFAGGLISGGAGAGGRIALHVSSTFTFNGTFDSSAGTMQQTYDMKNPEFAGPGTIFLSIPSFQGVIVSNRSLTGYLAHLTSNTPPVLASETVDVPLLSNRGAYVLPETSYQTSINPCLWRYHIVGLTSLYLSNLRLFDGDDYCLDSIKGSGLDAKLLLDNTSFVYDHQTTSRLIVDSISLHLVDPVYESSFQYNATIGANGMIYFYRSSSAQETTPLVWNNLLITSSGGLYFMNNSILTVQQSFSMIDNESKLIILANNTLSLRELTLNITSGRVTIPTTIPTSHRAVLLIESTSTVNVYSSLDLNQVEMIVDGELILHTNAQLTTLSSTIPSILKIRSGGKLTIQGYSTALNLPVYFEEGALLTVEAKSSLMLTEGGVAYNNSNWNLTAASSSVAIHSTAFYFDYESTIQGNANSSIVIASSGLLQPPRLVTTVAPQFIIQSGGTCSYSSVVDSSVNEVSATVAYLNQNKILVEAGGIFDVGSARNVTVNHFVLSGGTISFSGQTSFLSFVHAPTTAISSEDSTLIWKSGTITGNGTITIHPAASLLLELTSTLSPALLLLQTTIINYGNITAMSSSSGSINLVQHAKIENYHWLTIDSHVAQTWQFDEELYGFQEESYQLSDIPSFSNLGYPTLFNLSVTECAYLCVHQTFKITTMVEVERLSITSETCLSFLYQAKWQACQLLASTIEENAISHVALTDAYGWQAYNKVTDWIIPPEIINHATGQIQIQAASNWTVQIPLVNDGIIMIEATGSMAAEMEFLQGSSGILEISGQLTVNRTDSDNQLSGNITGDGKLVFTQEEGVSGTHTMSNLYLLAPSLSLEITSGTTVAIDSTESWAMEVKALTLSTEAILSIISKSLALTVRKEVVLENAAKIVTSDAILTSDSCTSCYDLSLSTPVLWLRNETEVSVRQGIFTIFENLTVESTAALSCAGRGYSTAENYTTVSPFASSSTSPLLGAVGGSHAGFGGQGFTAVPVLTTLSSFLKRRNYGNLYEATTWGQPGGLGHSSTSTAVSTTQTEGGGRLTITVMNHTLIDGAIVCDGMTPTSSVAGGGAGGSIILQTPILAGEGKISSVGGDGGTISSLLKSTEIALMGEGGGGGGGRLVLFLNELDPSVSVTAAGGSGFQAGSAGTIYLNRYETTARAENGGTLLLSNSGSQSSSSSILTLPTILAESTQVYGPLNHIIVDGSAEVVVNSGASLSLQRNITGDNTGVMVLTNSTILRSTHNSLTMSHLNEFRVLDGCFNVSEVTLEGSSLSLSAYGSTLSPISAGNYSFYNLSLTSSSMVEILYHATIDSQSSDWVYTDSPITLKVQDRLAIDATSALHSDNQGFEGSSAPTSMTGGSCTNNNANTEVAALASVACGEFGSTGGGGGAHGGNGGAGFEGGGGVAYGSLTHPVSLGTGGGGSFEWIAGGAGGGAMILDIHQLVLEGRISANGAAGSDMGAGGGAGGSILLTCDSITGSGLIAADGGNGIYSNTYFGGAGSGGRILLNCGEAITSFLSTGSLTSYGGFATKRTALAKNSYPIWNSQDISFATWLMEGKDSLLPPRRASAGTILIDYNSTYRHLWIHNNPIDAQQENITIQNCLVTGQCQTIETSLSYGEMDNLFSTSSFTTAQLSLQEMVVKIEATQTLTIQQEIIATEGSELHVYGTLVLPNQFVFTSLQVYLYGQLLGAKHLLLQNHSSLFLYSNATWNPSDSSQLPTAVLNESNLHIYRQNNYSLHYCITENVTLLNHSSIYLMNSHSDASSTATDRTILIAKNLYLSLDSSISADGEGYQPAGNARTSANSHTGLIHPLYQASGNVSFGDGGWAAGRGGGYYYDYPATGNAFYPIELGTAGGSTYYTSGNAGGGNIHLIVENDLYLHGSMTANGEGCLSTVYAGGGGSGGSIWAEVHGNLIGSGRLSAKGGDGCLVSGGAGSGGRIALYVADVSLTSFTGQIIVEGGNQSTLGYVDGQLSSLPAGGTIIIGNVDYLSAGIATQLITSNQGKSGSAVYLTGSQSCEYHPGKASFAVKNVQLADIDLYIDHCDLTIHQTIQQYPSTSSIITVNDTIIPHLYLSNQITVYLLAPLVLADNVILSLQESYCYFHENITLTKNSQLEISALTSQLIGWNESLLIALNNGSISKSNVVSSPQFSFPSSTLSNNDGLTMSFVEASSIQLSDQAVLSFLSSSIVNITASNIIKSRQLSLLSSETKITATGILQNLDFQTYGSHPGYYSTVFPFLGAPGGSSYAANGGANAGAGTTGSNSPYSSSVKRSENSIYLPLGPGGPGGNDRTRLVSGGGGGGGLLFEISEEILIDGVIDASGGSASVDTAAGGGAGGAIFFYSPAATLRGNGSIAVNGGNGSISATSSFHSGAGSGGYIHLLVCSDKFVGDLEAKGGLSVQLPSGVNATTVFTTAQYQKALGLNSLTTVQNYLALQRIVTASPGLILRNAPSIQGVSTGFDSQCSSEIVQNSYFNPTNHQMTFAQLEVSGWTLAEILQDNSSSVGSAIRSTLLYPKNPSPSLVRTPTVLSLSTESLSTLSIDTFLCENAMLNFTGTGEVLMKNITANSDCSVSFLDDLALGGKTARQYDYLSLYFYDRSHLMSGQSLVLDHGAMIYCLNQNFTSPSSSPSSLTAFLEKTANLSFSDVIIRNYSAIYGGVISLDCDSLRLEDYASLSTTGYGYAGATALSYSTSTAQGEGYGANGEIGGDGGGYGGFGAKGLSNLYEYVQSNEYISLSNVGIAVNQSYNASLRYGNAFTPYLAGSGGGACAQEFGDGGNGGGVIYVALTGNLSLDATSSISSDGASTYDCGGGGAGGSIWIQHKTSSGTSAIVTYQASANTSYGGYILGEGQITAKGGQTCSYAGCITNIDAPGGAGGGGRIRIEKDFSYFSGSIRANSGLQTDSVMLLETKRMGSIVTPTPLTALSFNSTTQKNIPATERDWIDITFLQYPIYPIQVITTSGQGNGSHSASASSDEAIVRGFWILSYREKTAFDTPLSSQATATEVQQVLYSFDYPELSKISVSRQASTRNGWIWSITFYQELERVAPLAVDATNLWCTEGIPILTVEIINHFIDPLTSTSNRDFNLSTDSPANYTTVELQSMLRFNEASVLATAFGRWVNLNTFRIFPIFASTRNYTELLGRLVLEEIFAIPMSSGRWQSLTAPVLQNHSIVLEMTKNPTSTPTMRPSDRSTGLPSTMPSGKPSNQPTSAPSIPTCHPSSIPSTEPSDHPTAKPSVPTSQPSSSPTNPTNVPSSAPSTAPSAMPSALPSSKPSNHTAPR